MWETPKIENYEKIVRDLELIGRKPDHYTCSRCINVNECAWAWNEYNVNGDCWAVKEKYEPPKMGLSAENKN